LDPTSDIIDGNGIAILIVTATLPDGTCHQIEATIGYPFPGGSKGAAIQANGDITMNGAFNVQGSLGSVQANGNISGNGGATATVEISVDASGSATGLTMKNNPAKGINSGAAPLNIQPVDVGAFAYDPKYADLQNRMWILNKDGTVAWKGGAGGGVVNPLSAGFTFKNGAWTMSGSSKIAPENAVYFIDGDFAMSGQGNSAPYTMTIIATGSVEMGGNAKFQPATKDGLDPIPDPYGGPIPTNTFGSLIVAGQDLSLRGTGSGGGIQYQGSTFANEQVEIKGNFTMNGSITAADATDTPGSKVSSSSSLAPDLTLVGNPTIIDNGTATIINSSPDHVNLLNLIRVK
jgi:hypothetical protein